MSDTEQPAETADPTTEEQNPFAHTYQVALYRDLEHAWVSVLPIYPAFPDYPGKVQISQAVEVSFAPLQDDQVLQSALNSLNELERKATADFARTMSNIKQQRANFLALTHQPASPPF